MKILSQAIIVFIGRLSFKFRLLSHAPPLSRCPPTTPKFSCHFLPPLLVRLQGHCSALAPLSLPHPPPFVFWCHSRPPCSFGSRGKGLRSARCLLSCSFLRQSQDIKQHRSAPTFRPLPLSRSPTRHPLNIIKTKNIRFFKKNETNNLHSCCLGCAPLCRHGRCVVRWCLPLHLHHARALYGSLMPYRHPLPSESALPWCAPGGCYLRLIFNHNIITTSIVLNYTIIA